jgi:hypothetical protein
VGRDAYSANAYPEPLFDKLLSHRLAWPCQSSFPYPFFGAVLREKVAEGTYETVCSPPAAMASWAAVTAFTADTISIFASSLGTEPPLRGSTKDDERARTRRTHHPGNSARYKGSGPIPLLDRKLIRDYVYLSVDLSLPVPIVHFSLGSTGMSVQKERRLAQSRFRLLGV